MNFTVYKSSAGSGKTYTLVKEYLKIALQSSKPDHYRGILAITFTNKATSEMKERIISALKALSSHEKLTGTNSFLQKDLVSELNVDEDILRARASNTLTHILHHYSDFAISTIDKFVYKIVRAFARDLHIPMNFEVELDAENLLRNAIDQLLSKAGTDPLLTRILIEFTEAKTEDEKSWKIENDLFDFASETLKEESMEFSEKLKETDLSQFFRIKEELLKQVKIFESDIKKIGKDALLLIENSGIPHQAFAGGKNGIAKYFTYLSECRSDKLNPSPAVQGHIEEDKWYAGKINEYERENIDRIKNALSGYYFNATGYLEKNSRNYFLHQLILQNIYSLAVLRELELIIDEIKSEKNIIHISEFNKKIAAIVTKESAPFIYERLGERYRHFLIDEFQDTSSLQWLNLLPLVHNSLSEGNFNMLVGDGKQAIYRWRSGDVEQFARLPQIINPGKNELLAEREQALKSNHAPKFLNKNFRSKREIVEFNNFFFGELSLKLNENYRDIYHGQQQEFSPGNSGGFVNVDIFREGEEKELKQKYLERALEIILESQKENFQLSDICILCRKNSDASEMAAFLLGNNIQVISSESLLLSHSSEVNFIVSFLSFLHNREDKKFQTAMAVFLVENKLVNSEDLHTVLSSINQKENGLNFTSWLKNSGFEINLFQLQRLPLYELTETIVRTFSLNAAANPYITFFLNLVHSFSLNETSNIAEFLEYWEKKKSVAAIVTPEGLNAVSIMTIHKSKGLEFPVVIFPFANWQENLTKDFLWIDVPQTAHGLQAAIVEFKKDLEQTCFSDKYSEEKNKSRLDSFNLLYVAFTRAKDRLYVISSVEKQKNLSRNFIEILQKHEGWDEESFSLQYGAKSVYSRPASTPGREAENFQYTISHNRSMISSDWRERVRISSNAEKYIDSEKQKNYGKLLHYALSFIHCENEVETAMERLSVSGICGEEEKADITEKIKKLLSNPDIKPFFETGLTVKTEAEILLSRGEIYRPDRVILYEDSAVIIDYKTGVPNEKHKEQVEKYAEAIREMGYKKVEKYLIYTENETVIKI